VGRYELKVFFHPVKDQRISFFAIDFRAPSIPHFLRNGWETNIITVYTISENALVTKLRVHAGLAIGAALPAYAHRKSKGESTGKTG
jgi:hypothetical protein